MQIKTRNMLHLCVCVGIMLFSSTSQADPVLPDHTDDRWQDLSDVSWSTDGGSNWGKEILTVGQTVQFKFIMHKNYVGTHYADLLKAWIDWNDSDVFDSNESIIFGTHVVSNTYTPNTGVGADVDEYSTYQTSGLFLTNNYLGDHWLLARVTCSESLLDGTTFDHNQWNDQWKAGAKLGYNSLFEANKSYWQGEAELYKLTVTPVPEPATMLLLGTGLIGLAGAARRKQK